MLARFPSSSGLWPSRIPDPLPASSSPWVSESQEPAASPGAELGGARTSPVMSGEFQFHDELASLFGQRAPPAAGAEMQQQQHSWFAEYLQAGGTQMVTDYDLLCRALDMPVVEDDDVKREQQQLAVDVSAAGGAALTQSGGGTAPLTPNTTSSLSSSSSEAGGGGGGGGGGGVAGAGEEDSMGRCKKEEGEEEEDGMAEDDGDKSKKGAAAKGGKAGKGEKRPRQPRFAFMTKSEVDHLEDGYRWRKYGQKAVKNSPYPRSYYRCTTQKCPVKKRVERSFQDPAVVITTYEGKHTHPIPSTLRGSTHLLAAHLQHHHAAGGHLAMPPPLGGAGAQYFGRHGGAIDVMSFLQPRANNHHAMPPTTMGLHASTHGMGGAGAIGSVAATAAGASPPSSLHQMQHFTPQDHFGLLQDMLPPFIHSNNQP